MRYDRIAAEYLNAHRAAERCVVVAPAHDECKSLNQAIRDTLVKHGHVATLGQEHQILVPRALTTVQLQHAQSYHQGDVLYFRRGSKRQGIPKGPSLSVANRSNRNPNTVQKHEHAECDDDPAGRALKQTQCTP